MKQGRARIRLKRRRKLSRDIRKRQQNGFTWKERQQLRIQSLKLYRQSMQLMELSTLDETELIIAKSTITSLTAMIKHEECVLDPLTSFVHHRRPRRIHAAFLDDEREGKKE